MITRKDGEVHFNANDYEILIDIWEGFKIKYGHDPELFHKKINEWLNTLPEKE